MILHILSAPPLRSLEFSVVTESGEANEEQWEAAPRPTMRRFLCCLGCLASCLSDFIFFLVLFLFFKAALTADWCHSQNSQGIVAGAAGFVCMGQHFFSPLERLSWTLCYLTKLLGFWFHLVILSGKKVGSYGFSKTAVATHGLLVAFCWSSPRAKCAGYGGGSRGYLTPISVGLMGVSCLHCSELSRCRLYLRCLSFCCCWSVTSVWEADFLFWDSFHSVRTMSGGELLKLETGQARAAFELVREVGSVNLVPTQAPCGFLCARVPRTHWWRRDLGFGLKHLPLCFKVRQDFVQQLDFMRMLGIIPRCALEKIGRALRSRNLVLGSSGILALSSNIH